MIHLAKANKRQTIKRGQFIIESLPLGNALPHHPDHGFYQLGRLDHATLHPGVLVSMHLHRDDEILSYMRQGTLHHKDSNGNEVAIDSQNLMMMNAGKGFYHEEAVPNEARTVEMLQIFLRPRKDSLTPNVQFYKFPEAVPENSWRLIAGKETSDAPLKINSEVNIFDVRLKASSLNTPAIQDPKIGFLYVFEGQAKLPDGTALEKGDSVYSDQTLSLTTDHKALLVFFELDTLAVFSRNGLYAR